jgi:hypothetical protein
MLLEDRTLLSSLWSDTATPDSWAVNDPDPVELGVKFHSDVAGYVTALRFYKSSADTGTDIGYLWSGDGDLLAAAVFTNETASGWQQVALTTPVAISPNTVYVASYYTDGGHYFADRYYFSGQGVNNAPIHAPADSSASHNGVYVYGALNGAPVFPTESFEASNYWVDVVFTTARTADTMPPVAVWETPAPGATGLPANLSALTVTVSEPIQPNTISFVLADAKNNVVPSSVSYDSSTLTITLTPVVTLSASSVYTATLKGVRDIAGNVMAAPVTWSFTTGDYLAADGLSIPFFGDNPTITSIKSGFWSNPNTWSGERVPSAGDVVNIAANTVVTYNVVSQAVLQAITVLSGAQLVFAPNVNTEVIAANFLVLPGGTLQVGTQANPVAPNVTTTIMTANQPLNTSTDPEQYGDSLIGLGDVTMYGAYKTPFGQLATEPHAGDTTLTFSSPVTGWRPGDQLYIPDTRQLDWNQYGSNYVPEMEYATIAYVSVPMIVGPQELRRLAPAPVGLLRLRDQRPHHRRIRRSRRHHRRHHRRLGCGSRIISRRGW